MVSSRIPFPAPELGFFEHEDPDRQLALEKKLAILRGAGPSKLHGVVDWDQTATDDTYDTFSVALSLASEAGQEESAKLSAQYYPLEKDGTITPEQAIEWWQKDVAILARERVALRDVVEHALGTLSLREGAKETFDLFDRHEVPVIILSAGIADIIEAVAERNGIKSAGILGNRLATDKDGIITGFKGEIIHGLNKQEHGHANLEELRIERPYTLLVGNSIGDARMVNGAGSVLRARVGLPNDSSPQEAKQYRDLAYEASYDLVTQNGSLHPIRQLGEVILSAATEQR